MKFIRNNKFLLKSKFLKADRKVKTLFKLDNFKEVNAVFLKYLKEILVFSLGNTRVTNRFRHIVKFLNLIQTKFSHHGASYTVKWLKANHTAIQRSVAGQPYRTLREIEPTLPLTRLINGLPGFIGSMDRKEISLGNTNVIRMWLSVLSFYRVLDAPRSPKLNTITDTFKGSHKAIDEFVAWFYGYTFEKDIKYILKRGINISCLKADYLRLTPMAGPNGPSYKTVLTDAYALQRETKVINAIRNYSDITGSALFGLLEKSIEITNKLVRYDSNLLHFPTKVEEWNYVGKPGKMFWKPSFVKKQPYELLVGRLVGLPEAAGKLRVIALVDVWTQSLLKPLHDTLFRILKRIPNDGTFDQTQSVLRSAEKAAKYKVAYSVDLSSATDRLPISLQSNILNAIFGHQIGNIWCDIMVERRFEMKTALSKEFYDGQELKYGTGQPMGCLSSWAMLAITHHCILQYCARHLSGHKTWYDAYEILGDDLVIFNKEVYTEYLRFMSEIDVGTNPSKSLVSEDTQTFEFAKRTLVKGIDVSGLSWKQFMTSHGIKGSITLALKLGEQGLLFRDGLLLRVLNLSRFKKNNIPRNTEVLQGQMLSLLSHFAVKGEITFVDAISYTQDPRSKNMGAFANTINKDNIYMPLRVTLHDLKELISTLRTIKSDNQKLESPIKDIKLSLNRTEERAALVKQSIGRKYTNQLFKSCLDKIIKFEQTKNLFVPILANQLMNWEGSNYELVKTDWDSSLDFNRLIMDLANSFIYRNKEPDDLLSRILRFELTYEGTTAIEEIVEICDSLDQKLTANMWLINGLKRDQIPDSIKSWMQIDLEKALLGGFEYSEDVFNTVIQEKIHAHYSANAMNYNNQYKPGMKTKRFIALNPVPDDDPLLNFMRNLPRYVYYLDDEYFYSHKVRLENLSEINQQVPVTWKA